MQPVINAKGMNDVRQAKLAFGLMIVLILAAFWLRLWRLPDVPPGFWFDEAYSAMDALWMIETRAPQAFLIGNYGREPMFHYLGGLSMAVLGAKPYAFRLVSALASMVTIPLVYRWLVTFFPEDPDRHWLGLTAAAGMTFSSWYTVMSRTGYRASLLPPCVALTLFLFWRAWRTGSWRYFAGAGVALGLSQYTYTSARLLPLVFGLFALARATVARRQATYPPRRRGLWPGLLVMAAASLIVFLPLGLFFVQNPDAFSLRAGSVFVVSPSAQGINLPGHLLEAFRVFIDGSDPNWRHNLVGRPAFDWLSTAGFWIGLAVCISRLRRPGYLFLLISLFVLWLPAPLSTPAVHSLRTG
jgi:4-amino-4-deoxy-L-arabinose transferase-like glycosyltransferase